MLFKTLRKVLCRHKYTLLTRYETDSDMGVGYKLIEKYIMYCTKCKHETEMLKHEYEKTMAIQDIEENQTRD